MSDRLRTATCLTVPGWNGSGPGHWQTVWEQRYASFRRVDQRDWRRPNRKDWLDAIDHAVQQAGEPVFLIAHSLGCLAVALWAQDLAEERFHQIKGALLVAPPWVTLGDACPKELADFVPMPRAPLPFPSILAASENDPYLPLDLAIRLSNAWRSEFVNLGRQGHVNISSGHGPWVEGECLLEGLIIRTTEAVEYDAVAKR